MSLTDLEKRAVLKPVEAELDRQKEKVAAVKTRLEALQAYVAQHISRTPGIQGLAEALEESKKI